MEHRLVDGGDQYLPFARSRIKAMRATGLPYATQRFTMPDGEVVVRTTPDHDYITLKGNGGALWVLLTAEQRSRVPDAGAGTDTKTSLTDVYSISRTSNRESLLLRFNMFTPRGVSVQHHGVGQAVMTSSGSFLPASAHNYRGFWYCSSAVTDSSGYLNTVESFMPYAGKAALLMSDAPTFLTSSPPLNTTATFRYATTAITYFDEFATLHETTTNAVKYGGVTWGHSLSRIGDYYTHRDDITLSTMSDTFSGDHISSPLVVTGDRALNYAVRTSTPHNTMTGGVRSTTLTYADWATYAIAPNISAVLTRTLDAPRTALIDSVEYSASESWQAGVEGFAAASLPQRVDPALPFSRREVGWHKQGWNFIHYYQYVYDRRNSPASERKLESYKTSIVLSSTMAETRFLRWKNNTGSMAVIELCSQLGATPNVGNTPSIVTVLGTLDLSAIAAVKSTSLIAAMLGVSHTAVAYFGGPNLDGGATPASGGAATFDHAANTMVCQPYYYSGTPDALSTFVMRLQILPDQKLMNDPTAIWAAGK